jgi:hypothetical protein
VKANSPPRRKPALDFMVILHGITDYEFAEGEGVVKKQPIEVFKTFLSNLPKQVEFSEVAKERQNIESTGSAAEKIDSLIREK